MFLLKQPAAQGLWSVFLQLKMSNVYDSISPTVLCSLHLLYLQTCSVISTLAGSLCMLPSIAAALQLQSHDGCHGAAHSLDMGAASSFLQYTTPARHSMVCQHTVLTSVKPYVTYAC
jgi:hypothetical protein